MVVRILISDPTDWYKQIGSDVIKYVDKSSGSHCSIAIETYTGTKVYEAVFPRSRVLTFDEWAKHNYIVREYHYNIPAIDQYDVFVWLAKQVGKVYVIPQLVLIALLKLLPIKIKKLNGRRGLICSELVARFMTIFLNFKFDKSFDTIGVKDIEDACEKARLTP